MVQLCCSQELFIGKVNEALEDYNIGAMSYEEQKVFNRYLEYLNEDAQNLGSRRVDVNKANSVGVVSAALDAWLQNTMLGLPERNPTSKLINEVV